MRIVALNNTSVKTAEITNAYIKAPCGEKLYVILGPEYGPNEGKISTIV